MSTSNAQPDPLAARRRLAEEWLLESSSWRKNLDDSQAQRLMNWARRHVHKVVAETAVLPDDEAEAMIDEAVTAVRRLMRQIDGLTPQLPQLDEASANQALAELNAALEPLTYTAIPEFILHQVVADRPANAPDSFNALYHLLTWDTEEE